MKQNGFLCNRCAATFYSRDKIKDCARRRFNEYVVIAVLLLVACLTHFGAAYAGTTDPTRSRLVGAASPAHPTGAGAVVRRFYAWYMSKAVLTDYLAPVRGLFDGRLYWLLKQENANHPGAKFRGAGSCGLITNPFTLSQAGGRIFSFTVGAPIAQSNAIVVPVTLFLGGPNPAQRPPGVASKINAIVKGEAGTYKIYDINGLRKDLEGFARDPNCAWPRQGK